jgi:hypothetical protein
VRGREEVRAAKVEPDARSEEILKLEVVTDHRLTVASANETANDVL